MEANIAYYCLHKFHLEVQERAYVVAAVQIKLEKNKKEAQKAKKGRKR